MALTDAQKVAVRRHCGYPLFGGQPVQAFGHRFYQHYGTLEFRMNNMQAAEEAVVTDMLTSLGTLETDIFGTRDNSDTQKAAVWERNKYELAEKKSLYSIWQQKLCDFFGVPRGPGARSNGSIELVV